MEPEFEVLATYELEDGRVAELLVSKPPSAQEMADMGLEFAYGTPTVRISAKPKLVVL